MAISKCMLFDSLQTNIPLSSVARDFLKIRFNNKRSKAVNTNNKKYQNSPNTGQLHQFHISTLVFDED